MRNWHETERHKAAERRAKVAAAPSTVGISKRPGRPHKPYEINKLPNAFPFIDMPVAPVVER